METKDLLSQVAQHVREQGGAEDDPIWERLSRGELGADEDAALRARAAQDPEIALRYEAFRPLGREVKERLVQQATRELATPPSARELPWRRVAVAAMVPLAAAAALLLFLHRPATQPDAAPLPAYALTLSGGDRATRGDAPRDEAVELRAGSQVEIVLRPATAVAAPITVEAFVVQAGKAKPWPVPMDRSSDGAVRIAGEAGALFGAVTGPMDLAFVVGPAGLPPVDPAEVARAAAGAGAAHPWQLLERRVRVVDGN